MRVEQGKTVCLNCGEVLDKKPSTYCPECHSILNVTIGAYRGITVDFKQRVPVRNRHTHKKSKPRNSPFSLYTYAFTWTAQI